MAIETDRAAEQPWWRTVTRYQWAVLLIAWLGWVFDVMDTALFNFAKQSLITEILGSPEAYKLHGPAIEGQVASVFLIGWAVGGLVFGVLADRWGRTRVMALTILLYCLFTGLTALCQTVPQLMVVRFLTGLGIGGEWAAGAALLAEVFPQRARANAAGFLQSAAAVGPWLASFINRVVISNDLGWRVLFLVGILPAIITVFIRWKLKEPERWQQAAQKAPGRAGSLPELFGSPKWRRHLIVASLLGIVGIIGAWNTSYWLPNLVLGLSEGVSAKELAICKSAATDTLHIGTILGVLFFPLLCERIGRRRAFMLFLALAPLAMVSVSLGVQDFRTLLFVAPLLSFFTIGLTAGFALYFPELFPTRLRATGAGFCYNTGRILAAPLPALAGFVFASVGGSVARGVALFSIVYVVGIAAAAVAPETKGRPLPEE